MMAYITRKTLSWRQINGSHQRLLGEKCYKLAHYKKKGFPVPPFFAIPNTLVAEIIKNNAVAPGIKGEIREQIGELESETGKKFGGNKNPLTLIVRSGDPRNLHGALLSLMGIGLNDITFNSLLRENPGREKNICRLYLDLIFDFALHVGGLKRSLEYLQLKAADPNLGLVDYKKLIEEAERFICRYSTQHSLPKDVYEQVSGAVIGVAMSWQKTEARVAATSIGIDWKKEMPSVFVQEFMDGSMEDAFVSMTTPPPFGRYVPGTSGRYVMSGTHRKKNTLGYLQEKNPTLYTKVMKYADGLVAEEKAPLNIEGVISGGRLNIFQICQANLSPPFLQKAIEEMEKGNVISGVEADRMTIESVVRNDFKLFKLNPEAKFREIAQALPVMGVSGSPSQMAMCGDLAFTVSEAFLLKDRGKRVIFFSTDPRDENLYKLLHGRGNRIIDGLIATYSIDKLGSHIVDIAMAVGIPVVASLKDYAINPLHEMFPMLQLMPFCGHRLYIGNDNYPLNSGSQIVIEGRSGKILVTKHSEPIVEVRTVVNLSYDVNLGGLVRSMRDCYQPFSYEDILAEHGKLVRRIGNLEENRKVVKDKGKLEQISGELGWLQSKTHVLHIFGYEKGKNKGLSRRDIDLDVAVADGNLGRIPGLENKQIAIERIEGRVMILIASEIEYNGTYYQEGDYARKDAGRIYEAVKGRGVTVRQYIKTAKFSRHTNQRIVYGIELVRSDLEAVVDVLKDYFNEI
ncbi:MAG: hypothetical protein U9R38_01415 [Candidatus Margulisiibacteriota bacterium]|nr:hypothetical protein [Candidatus Margulisiibacteriota bacterium]